MSAYVTRLTEAQVLDYFWSSAREGVDHRLALLKQIAAVEIERPSDWDYAAVRAINPWDVVEAPDKCFSCLTASRRLYWHHIIAVSHGGSATRWNLTAICYRCHRIIHPWLAERSDQSETYVGHGFESVGQIARRIYRIEEAPPAPTPGRKSA